MFFAIKQGAVAFPNATAPVIIRYAIDSNLRICYIIIKVEKKGKIWNSFRRNVLIAEQILK